MQVHFKASVRVKFLGSSKVPERPGLSLGGLILPKNVDMGKHRKLGTFMQTIYHRCSGSRVVILNQLDGYQGDSTIRVVEFTFSTVEEEGTKLQPE